MNVPRIIPSVSFLGEGKKPSRRIPGLTIILVVLPSSGSLSSRIPDPVDLNTSGHSRSDNGGRAWKIGVHTMPTALVARQARLIQPHDACPIFSSLPESCEPPLFKGTPTPVGRLRLHHRPHICRTGGKTMTTSVTPYFVPFPAGPIPPRSSVCPFTSYYRIFNFEYTLTSTARHRGPLSTI